MILAALVRPFRASSLVLSWLLASQGVLARSFQDELSSLPLPDGGRVVLLNKSCSTCPDPVFQIEDAEGRLLGTMPSLERSVVISKAVTPDGRFLITSSSSGEGVVRIYDLKTRRAIKQLRGTREPGGYSRVDLSPDGKSLSVLSQWGQPPSLSASLKFFDMGLLPQALPERQAWSTGTVEIGPQHHALGERAFAVGIHNWQYGASSRLGIRVHALEGQALLGAVDVHEVSVSAWALRQGRLLMGLALRASLQKASPEFLHYDYVLLDLDLATGEGRVGTLTRYQYGSTWGQLNPLAGEPGCAAYKGEILVAMTACHGASTRRLDELPREIRLPRGEGNVLRLDEALLSAAAYGPGWRSR